MPEYPITAQSAYFANIAKIINYFRHTKGSGFLFCACDSQALVQEINRQIQEKAKANGLNIAEVYLTSEQTEDSLDPIRAAAEQKPDGIILNNLNELILRSNGTFVREINFAREILIDLEVPLLFWLSEENMSRFANDAADLFSRKDRGVVHFTALSGNTAMDRFQDDYFEPFRQTEDYNSLKLKIELLEKQLKEAEDKKYSEKRIANEIVADLMGLYTRVYLRNEAWALFEKYEEHLDEIPKHLEIIAELCYRLKKWDNSLKYLLKLKKKYLEIKNWSDLGATYSRIGLIYKNKGQRDSALAYLLRSERIHLENGEQLGLGLTYYNIAGIYQDENQRDKALEYYLKSEKIFSEIAEWAELGIYNNISKICYNKGQKERDLKYFLKSGKIRLEIEEIVDFGLTCKNIGTIYLQKNDKEKANPYLILAGYIAKTLGMKHELSEWSEILNPLTEEMGEDRFMEEGKRLCEEKGIAV